MFHSRLGSYHEPSDFFKVSMCSNSTESEPSELNWGAVFLKKVVKNTAFIRFLLKKIWKREPKPRKVQGSTSMLKF